MKDKYEITNVIAGTPFFEVSGPSFSYKGLYYLVGKHGFMSTFYFKTGSDAFTKFGQSVTGVIYYAKGELESFDELNRTKPEQDNDIVHIDVYMDGLTIAQREELKYGGVLATDIGFLSFTQYKRPEERYESGDKKVPNIITIPYDASDYDTLDYDTLYLNYVISKNNSGVELTAYEIEKLIGITLGKNEGHIDSSILKHFGFDLRKVQDCQNIWYHVYKTKEKMGIICEQEKAKFADLKFIRSADKIIKLFSEIKRSNVKQDEMSRSWFEIIISSMSTFEPNILLHGKKQIFWDVDAYLHIVLRHVKNLQIGAFKTKTPFPYKFEDLEILIGQVLGTIEDEIKRHFQERPGKDFRRVGKMSVLFNGDYYCLQIDKDGRLVTLYVNG